MIVKSMTFQPSDNGRGIEPTSVVVEFSLRELALVARMIGSTNHTQRQAFQADGGEVGSELWGDITGSIFNAFWDDGLGDVPK